MKLQNFILSEFAHHRRNATVGADHEILKFLEV
jgi:hypothetical protein